MSANASLKESGADAVEDNRTKNKRSTSGRKPRGASYARLSVSAPSHRLTGGTRLLVTGAWILVVIQVLAIAGDLIHAHVRNPSIDAFLSAPSSRNIAGTLGLLVGTTLPGITALVGGLSLRGRTDHQRGNSLSISAAIAIVLMLGLQFMPRCSLANWRFSSTPSSRLTGHWESQNDPFYSHVDYGPSDSLGMGTCYAADGSVLFTFQILSEEHSGTRFVAREYRNAIALFGVEYCVSKDGRSMTKEYVFNRGHRLLSEYQCVAVSQRTQSSQGAEPSVPTDAMAQQQASDFTWTPESEFPPPIEVSHIIDVRGKPTAGTHTNDPNYWLDDLREGYCISGDRFVKKDGAQTWTLEPFVTAWKVTHIDSHEIRAENQGRTWVHKVGGRGWQLIPDNVSSDDGLGLR